MEKVKLIIKIIFLTLFSLIYIPFMMFMYIAALTIDLWEWSCDKSDPMRMLRDLNEEVSEHYEYFIKFIKGIINYAITKTKKR